MQQLFGLINEVLAHSPATAKRRLRIVTYKVSFRPSCRLCGRGLWSAGSKSMPAQCASSMLLSVSVGDALITLS